ncbi:MAG: hypothetical protein IPL61_32270 [Myxococcales bacterium]|nr:hypothetical protein [Myxococcales bacterium]
MRAALSVLLLTACLSARSAPWRPVDRGATATDVLAAATFTDRAPAEAIVVPRWTRWGDLAALAAVRGVYAGPEWLAVVSQGAVATVAPGAPAFVGVVGPDRPALVRLARRPGAPAGAGLGEVTVVTLDRADAPLDLPATLDDAHRRWTTYAAAADPALLAALVAAGDATPGQPLSAERRDDAELFVPSWGAGRLTVIYGRHLARASSRTTVTTTPCAKYGGRDRDRELDLDLEPQVPRQQPAPCPPPMPIEHTITRGYAADLALVLEYDRAGRLIAETAYPAHAVPGPAPGP